MTAPEDCEVNAYSRGLDRACSMKTGQFFWLSTKQLLFQLTLKLRLSGGDCTRTVVDMPNI